MRQITVITALAMAVGFGAYQVSAAAEAGQLWAGPQAMAIRRISDVASEQHELSFLGNLDCNLMTYRLQDSNDQRTGCFTQTAIGLVDGNSNVVIFNGTDEGQLLLPFGSHQGFVAWPQGGIISVVPDTIDGDYLGIYRNPLSALKDETVPFSGLPAKRLTAPPDFIFSDPLGNPLLINLPTLSISRDGTWLAAEDLRGSFIRINLTTMEILPFARAFGEQGSPGLLQSQVAISDSGRYIAIANKDAGSLKVYDLDTCRGGGDNLQPHNCAAYDYQPFINEHITNFITARHLRFINESLLSFEAETGNGERTGVFEIAPRSSIDSLIDYLGLGDSFTSGEGAFNYIAGTDTTNNMCHQSVSSYPFLLSRDIFGSGGHSVACSGAVIDDVGSLSPKYHGQAINSDLSDDRALADYIPGYLAQQRFARFYQPRIASLSVGGNDIGFGDILQSCVTPHLTLRQAGNSCYSSYEDRLEATNLVDRTVKRWVNLYKQLQSETPSTRLYIIGYPQTVYPNGNCAINVHLDKSELQFATQLTDYLNTSIQQAAAAAGVPYIDISQALAGHRLCETASYQVAVNGLTAGTDAGPFGLRIFGKESYHPNALGQRLIEQAILNQTGGFKPGILPDGPGPVGLSAADLLNAPRTGRTVNSIVPDDTIAPGVILRGQPVRIQVDGLRDGLRPATIYQLRLDGQVIDSFSTDSSAAISSLINLAETTPPGGHSLTINGPNQANEPISITQPVYVAASSDDLDGDGVVDVFDRCPVAANSGQDTDLDGIDDTCDGYIGQISSINNSYNGGFQLRVHTTDSNPALSPRPINKLPSPPPLETGQPTATKHSGGYIINWLRWLEMFLGLWMIVLCGALVWRYQKR